LSSLFSEFSPNTGEVTIGDITKTLRPKTFQLAQYLAEHSGEVISKDNILNTVWGDSIVEEQAVFQSVNEIRKAFAPQEVIKTYPRRGYTWLIPCKPVERPILVASSAVDAHNHHDDNSDAKSDIAEPLVTTDSNTQAQYTRFDPSGSSTSSSTSTNKSRKNSVVWFCIALVLAFGGYSFYITDHQEHGNSQTNGNNQANGSNQTTSVSETVNATDAQAVNAQALLVLPFDTSNLDSDERWLRYGLMDAVIQQVNGNETLTVFQADDTLDILTRKKQMNDNPALLFSVSGATLIVDGRLSGVPGEYTLIYTLYERGTQQHGVIHSNTTDQLLSDLLSVIHGKLQITPTHSVLSFEKQFSDTLMFNAMQLLAANEPESAVSFLQSAIIASPEQPAAYYWLAKTRLNEGHITEAMSLLERLLSIEKLSEDDVFYSRALYLKASGQLARQQTSALAELTKALEAAEKNEDWLYVAYTHSMLGHYYLGQNSPQKAASYFTDAMAYQQMLNCPLGVIQGHLDWVDYYLASGNKTQAEHHLKSAQQLVNDKGLLKAVPLVESQRARL